MSQRVIIKICSIIMMVSGLIILFTTFYPIISYEWEASQRYPMLISPLVDKDTASFKFGVKDYTRASNWIEDGSVNQGFTSAEKKYFTISIPKLGIESATVVIGGDDLSESLVQFPGTALPGKNGNSVIFGHSILPQYYNPKNYLSIFSTLSKLVIGDDIFLNYDGIVYEYRVEKLFEVKPSDIQILEQNRDNSYISLVTCTPPGHPLKPRRLIVRAKLKPLS